MLHDLTAIPADAAPRSTRHALVMALGVSVALHAALLGWVPRFNQEPPAPVRLSALEVVVRVPAESLPPAAGAPASQPPQIAQARPSGRQGLHQREAGGAAVPTVSHTRPEVALPGSSADRTEPDRSPESATAQASKPLPAAATENGSPAAPVVASATYLENPAPRYPETARRMGQEGTVMLRVLVTADGAAAHVALERSSGSPHLDGAALERVRNWRFRPARQGSAPVESWVLVPIVFRLESAS